MPAGAYHGQRDRKQGQGSVVTSRQDHVSAEANARTYFMEDGWGTPTIVRAGPSPTAEEGDTNKIESRCVLDVRGVDGGRAPSCRTMQERPPRPFVSQVLTEHRAGPGVDQRHPLFPRQGERRRERSLLQYAYTADNNYSHCVELRGDDYFDRSRSTRPPRFSRRAFRTPGRPMRRGTFANHGRPAGRSPVWVCPHRKRLSRSRPGPTTSPRSTNQIDGFTAGWQHLDRRGVKWAVLHFSTRRHGRSSTIFRTPASVSERVRRGTPLRPPTPNDERS